ncbi:ABC transporter permease [Corallococcus exiguus]|uniref:FtsX-like permease family protein n=1 Tax=Corallococcus exiguus TaxID=83462 RepID=A0A7X4Y7P0_9BACT|nr:FtsX-like permease family protein [Corallococcus exiguus]NBC40266.1 FtsX-like permease family protein [Corallococcus exiguus]TNV66498.1 ABC transporter permease [Corallococcus exiguus]
MNYVGLAGRDLMRNPLRMTLTVLAGAVGVTAFIFLSTVVDMFYYNARAAQVDRLIVRNKVSFTQPLPLSYYARIAALPGVTAVTHQEWFGGTLGDTQKDFFANFAVDTHTFLDVFPEFIVPPPQLAAFRGDPCGALVGERLAQRFGWKPGDRVTLKGQLYPGDWTFNVHGIYRGARPGVDTTALVFGYRCLNESDRLTEALKDKVGIYAVRVDDPARSAEVAAAIDHLFGNSPYPTKTESEKAFQLGFVAMSSAIVTAVRVVSTVILLIILLVIGNTLAMGVRERTRDIATLRALGFRPRTVVALVLAESSFIGLCSAALGVTAAPVLVGIFAKLIASRFGPMPDHLTRGHTLWVSALAAVAVSLLAGVGPALRAVRLPVAEGLRKVA